MIEIVSVQHIQERTDEITEIAIELHIDNNCVTNKNKNLAWSEAEELDNAIIDDLNNTFHILENKLKTDCPLFQSPIKKIYLFI